MKRYLFLLVALVTLLVACGESTPTPTPNPPSEPVVPPPPSGGGELVGTVTAPAGGDVAQTELIACFLEASQCNPYSPNTQATVIGAAGPSGSFSFL